jgi:hypothetical protein
MLGGMGVGEGDPFLSPAGEGILATDGALVTIGASGASRAFLAGGGPSLSTSIASIAKAEATVGLVETARLVFLTEDLSAFSALLPLSRLRFLGAAVFSDVGRGCPCNLKYNPQALQTVSPSSFFRHRGVFVVLQFWHSVKIYQDMYNRIKNEIYHYDRP